MDTQTAKETGQKVSSKPKTGEPAMFLVYILNDDFTTFEFVVFVLAEVFGKTIREGWELALTVHVSGKGLAGRYTKDIAMTKINKATKIARDNGYPLRFVAEPEK